MSDTTSHFVLASVLVLATGCAAPTGQAASSAVAALAIQKQGSFAVGGTVVNTPGTYDNNNPTAEGRTFQGDHLSGRNGSSNRIPTAHPTKRCRLWSSSAKITGPIGVSTNYAMHPVNFYLRGVISADFPGEASRYIEDLYGNGAVAIFSQGASGDQNPRLTERGQTTVGAAPAPPAPRSSPPVAPAANSDRGFSPAAAQAERAAIPAAELAAYKAGSPARELSSS